MVPPEKREWTEEGYSIPREEGGKELMTVKVRFSYPYRKLVGKDEVELEVNGSTKVRELLRMVAERHPGFKEYADKGSDEQMSTHMVILLQDRVLRLEDAVEPGMTIQLMAPIAGGQ